MSTQPPREIAFEDIKKGDDIEARWERDGVVNTRRGIAYETNSHRLPEYWYTEAGGVVANNYDGNWKHFLHRPTVTEPTGLGAVVRATLRKGSRRQGVFVRSHPGPYGHVWRGLDDGWDWPAFDPDSIEVLSEGIEVES